MATSSIGFEFRPVNRSAGRVGETTQDALLLFGRVLMALAGTATIVAIFEVARRTADEIWFVGDTVSDMECAQRAGVLPVGIGEGSREKRLAPPSPRAARSRHQRGSRAAW